MQVLQKCIYLACQFFGELRRGKRPSKEQGKNEKVEKLKSERLRGEGDQINFIDLGFEEGKLQECLPIYSVYLTISFPIFADAVMIRLVLL